MASFKESSMEQNGGEEDDIRGDGKRKKFKPLSKMRKFFGIKKKKEDSVVAVKAKSTTALHNADDGDDEDDDGGFKSHQKPLSLAGNRSISEDSVFSPEQRETISPFPKSAVSEESLPKSAFQSELFSKLNKRRSQYSDEDDGLPRSPVPPITTADVIMGGPLKPGSSGKKSSNRDSDQSLISVDGSDIEEDLFQTKWKNSVPAKRKTQSQSSAKSDTSDKMENLDFSNIQKTEVLTSSAAKDRISVKPKARKATRHSRKKRDTSSPSSLPSLNEESPTRTQPEKTENSWISGSPKSPDKTGAQKFDVHAPSGMTASHGPASASAGARTSQHMPSGPKPNLSSINVSGRGNKSVEMSASATTSSSSTTSTVTKTPGTASPTKASTPTSPEAKFPPTAQPHKFGAVSHAAPTSAASSHVSVSGSGSSSSSSNTTMSTTTTAATSAAHVSSEKKAGENLSRSERGVTGLHPANDHGQLSQSTRGVDQGKAASDIGKPTDVRSRMSQFQPPTAASNKSGNSSSTTATSTTSTTNNNTTANETPESISLKVTDPESKVSMSPKDDYKLKRQNRSKTLPATTDDQEQSSPSVQRASSHRITSTVISSPLAQPAGSLAVDKPATTTTASAAATTTAPSSTAATTSASSVKKLENVKFASMDSPTSSPSEPAWMSKVRKQKEEQPAVDSTATATVTASANTPAVDSTKPTANVSGAKSVFSSSSYLEKKRGSIDTVSIKHRDTPEQSEKKNDNSNADAPSKQSSIDISSTRRESIEIDVKELSSVKALRNSFAANKAETIPKPSSQKDNKSSVPSVTPSSTAAADKAKVFSASTTHSASPSKPELTKQNSGDYDNVKSSGISHFRGGSVKTSPTKSSEVRSLFPARAGSVKAESPFTTPSSSTSTSPLHKADSKPDTTGSTLSSSTTPSSNPNPASESNSSLPPTSPAVNSSSSSSASSKPTSSAFMAKSAVNLASKTSGPTPSPTPAATFGVKPLSNPFGVKPFSHVSGVRSVASSSPVVSSSSSSSTTTSTTTSSSSSSSTPSVQTSSVRSHSSFNTSSAFKPQVSSLSPTSSRASSFNKTPTPTPVTLHAEEKKPSIPATTTTTTTAPVSQSVKKEEKKPEPSSNVPAWRANLPKSMKIEIIEKSPNSSSSSSSDNKSDVPKKSEPSNDSNVQAAKASNRSSKVLDLMKNFQNHQVPT